MSEHESTTRVTEGLDPRSGELEPEQSPIDIPASAFIHTDDLVFDYHPSAMRVQDDGYALQATPSQADHLEIDGHRYRLDQFHLHSPGEHTFAGKPAACELHLVHVDEAGAMAVAAVMLELGKHNVALEALLGHERPTIDPTDLLPVDRAYVAYRGSLTVPPYNEGVSWWVLVHPIHLSAGQLDRLRAIHHGNARPVQPLGGRDLGSQPGSTPGPSQA